MSPRTRRSEAASLLAASTNLPSAEAPFAEAKPRPRRTAPRDARPSATPGVSEGMARALLDAAADGIVAFDASGHLLFVNNEARRLLSGTHQRDAENAPDEISSLAYHFGGDHRFEEYRRRLAADLDSQPRHTHAVKLTRLDDSRLIALVTATRTHLHRPTHKGAAAGPESEAIVLTLRDIWEVRRVVDSIEEVRLRFADYLDQAHIAAVFADPESFRIVGSNETAQQLLGLESSSMQRMDVWSLFGANDLEEPQRLLREVCRDSRPRSGEWRLSPDGGRSFFGHLQAGVIAVNERRLLQLIISDITERRALEDHVRETRDFLEDLIRSSHLGIITYDVDFMPRSWNPETEKILGLDRRAAPDEASHPEGLLRLPQEVVSAARARFSLEARPEGSGSVRFSIDDAILYQRAHRSGRMIQVESIFSPIRNPAGDVIGAVEFARDITEKLKLEAETSYLRELNRQIVENIPSGIIVYTIDHRFKLVNRAFAKMVGVPVEYILGRTPRELGMSEESIHEIEGCTNEILATGNASSVKVHRAHFPSGWRSIRHSAIPLMREGDRLTMILGIFEDITEEEKLQLQLIQSDKLAAIGQLAAGIAHEIRSPLSSIYNALYDLNEIVDRTNRDIAEDIDISMEEIARVQAIINNLLDFARVGDEGVSAVDVNDVLVRTWRLMHKVLANQHIMVETQLDATDARVVFNENAMKQTLLNLMTNAMHAMPEGGTLVLRTRVQGSDGRVELDVEDTGCGIPAEIIGNIFNPFFTTKEPGRGTGLGLTVVHSAVTEHGGLIRVRSEPGRGTCFTLTLQRHPGRGEPARPS